MSASEETQAALSAAWAAESASSATASATSALNYATQAALAVTAAQEAATAAQIAAQNAGANTGTGSSDGSGSGVTDTELNTAVTAAQGSATAAANSATSATASASTATAQASAASTSAATATTQATTATTQATAAAGSATMAGTAATNAAASATAAAGSATAASGSATSAANSVTAATTQASAASGSASAAATSATNAGNSASAADTSATAAAASATAAAGSATTATTQAGNASTSATNAGNSATAAGTSQTAAAASATAASGSATSASGSATAAAASATTATTQAGNASTSATAAAGSATTASTSAGNASTSAGNASTSATNAGNSATAASTSATAAAGSATAAAGSATSAATAVTNATTQATNASNSATAAAASAAAAAASVGGTSGPALTLRNIATRCRHDQQYYTGANLTTCAGRSFHVNMGSDGVYGPQIVLGNWLGSNTGEVSPAGGAITEMVSIEYPAGQFTMASWDTANSSSTRTESISIPAGGADVVSDPVPVYIPRGQGFWIHRASYFTSGTAAQFPVSMTAVGTGPDTLFVGWTGVVGGNDLRSYLTGTAIAGSTTAMAQMRYPLAILGMSNNPSVLVLGDSRASGYNDSGVVTVAANPINTNGAADWGRWGFGEVARSLGHARAYSNLGCPTDSAHNYLTLGNTFRTRQAAYHTDVIVQYGINDVNLQARTEAATQADLSSIYALFPTKRVWAVTISPCTTSSDAWATNANQTVTASNTARVPLNNWLRTVPSPLAGCFDNATVIEGSLNSGIWNVVAGLGAPTGDGLHPTPLYYKWIDTNKSINPLLLTQV